MKYNKTFFNAFIICIIIFLSACSSVDIYDVPTVDDFGNTNGNIHEGGYAVYKNGWIYYTNTDDNDSLYKKRVDGSDSEKMISSGYCYAINVIDDWIYYISGIPGYVYRVSIDGTKKEKVDNRRSDNLIAVKSTLYYRITELTQGAICKLDLSSMKKKMIKKNVVEFSIDDKNIYYSDDTDNCNLYRTDFDGKNTVKINEDDTNVTVK